MEKSIRFKLDELVNSEDVCTIDGKECVITAWNIEKGDSITLTIINIKEKNKVFKTIKLDEIKDFIHDIIFITDKKFKQKNIPVSIPKTISDLRNILLENIGRIRAGTIDLNEAEAISKQTDSIVNLTRLELQYRKDLVASKLTKSDFLELGESEE